MLIDTSIINHHTPYDTPVSLIEERSLKTPDTSFYDELNSNNSSFSFQTKKHTTQMNHLLSPTDTLYDFSTNQISTTSNNNTNDSTIQDKFMLDHNAKQELSLLDMHLTTDLLFDNLIEKTNKIIMKSFTCMESLYKVMHINRSNYSTRDVLSHLHHKREQKWFMNHKSISHINSNLCSNYSNEYDLQQDVMHINHHSIESIQPLFSKDEIIMRSMVNRKTDTSLSTFQSHPLEDPLSNDDTLGVQTLYTSNTRGELSLMNTRKSITIKQPTNKQLLSFDRLLDTSEPSFSRQERLHHSINGGQLNSQITAKRQSRIERIEDSLNGMIVLSENKVYENEMHYLGDRKGDHSQEESIARDSNASSVKVIGKNRSFLDWFKKL